MPAWDRKLTYKTFILSYNKVCDWYGSILNFRRALADRDHVNNGLHSFAFECLCSGLSVPAFGSQVIP